ncbi:MAG: hypothetical protein HYT70_02745 [Candidatus Aenigmarchaeota archaeon]|nr:hypothetical protein [Candidatus Aenigmarchaeota archaeon]
MVYHLTVSSGLGSIGRDPNLMGLGKKIPSILTYGVNVVQADMETFTSAELFEPEVENLVKRFVDDLGIKWVMHGEIGQTVAFETALQQVWRQAHRRLHQYMDAMYDKFGKPKNMSKYLPGYIDFHISNMMSIGYFAERYRLAGIPMLDFKGRNSWIDLLNETPELKDWFRNEGMLYLVYGREIPVVVTSVDQIRNRASQEVLMRKIEELSARPEVRERVVRDYIQRYGRPPDERNMRDAIGNLPEAQPTDEEIKTQVYDEWSGATATRYVRGAITDEEIAYVLIAKYLEFKKNDPKEPLWKMYFQDRSMKDLEEKWAPKKLVNTVTGEIYLDPEIVAMVASRYVLGHFEADPLKEYTAEMIKKNPGREGDSFYEKSAIDKLKIIKVQLVFENPELSEGQIEGLQRIIRAEHMYYFAKAAEQVFKTDLLKILIDLNHWLHNAIDPAKEFEQMKKGGHDFGKYVRAVHIYEPLPIHHHNPFEIPSDQQFKIYKWLFQLRGLGFKEGYLVFERGGGQNPFEITRTAVLALRQIIENLDKGIDPQKLPISFYGISPEGILSEQRQRVIMVEHARDPLQGLIIAPEEQHTALGKEALAKPGMTPEKWKKEELR